MGILGILVTGFAVMAGFFDPTAIRIFPAEGKPRPIAAVFFSGDTGLRFGMGPYVSSSLARQGITVTGFSSPAFFGTHRTRAQVGAVVARTIRLAADNARGRKLVLIGQSYGADILQTGLATLPNDLRAHIAAIILVVPGETVFSRADPTGLAYRGTPDSQGASTVSTITWAPLTCIYGARETDSVCPDLHVRGARIVRMPGGHFLNKDRAGLVAQIMNAIRTAAPAAFPAASPQ